MKVCSTCKTQKPFSEFFKKKAAKDGLQSWCKKCKNDANLADCIKRRKNNKEKLFNKMGICCWRCKIIPDCLDVFDLHHKEPTKKERNISDLMLGSWKKLEKELDKCVLLCSNCHRITHYELRNQS